MKLQHLSVIFVIIIVPIAMVMSQYIQTQIDTIKLQSSYQKALDTATHDALTAFQINSVNNKYSSISDSKIRDVEAAINTFYNSLGTSMDIYTSKKEALSTYIPAILFTLYDGYYIHSLYENTYKKAGSEGDQSLRIEIDEDSANYQIGLHPYIYYSCKYLLNGKIVIVNYTLDNAITVYGDFGNGEGYQTKSGYLIDYTKVNNIQLGSKSLTYDGIEIGPETLTEHLLIQDGDSVTLDDFEYIVYNSQKVYRDHDGRYFYYENNKKRFLQSETATIDDYISNNGVGFKSISAFEYYYDAYNFSKWLVEETELDKIEQKDVIKMNETTTTIGNDTEYLSTNTGNEKIFDVTDPDNDPQLSTSIFNSHRMAIIQKSIETNLSTAIGNYQNSLNVYQFVLPVIDEENWYELTNNVSIVSFMQGIPLGMKYFNNYSVISNTKNEEVINNQAIYIMAQETTGGAMPGSIEYHRPGCKELIDGVNNGNMQIIGGYTSLEFLRQTAKLTEADIRYFYPQARVGTTTTGCYHCMVSASLDYNTDDIIKGEIRSFDTGNVLYNESELEEVRKMYLMALAREKSDLYKSNF